MSDSTSLALLPSNVVPSTLMKSLSTIPEPAFVTLPDDMPKVRLACFPSSCV